MWQIEKTLPQNLKNNLSMKERVNFILVDFGSTDGLQEWIGKNFEQELDDGYLQYYYTEELEFWHASIAKNTAHILSKSDILVNLDCDNYTGKDGGKFVLEKMIQWGVHNTVIHQPNQDIWNGSYGRIAISMQNFMSLGGYDESFEPMGYQDNDLLLRARGAGLKYYRLEDKRYNKAIKNDKKESIKQTGSTISWEEMDEKNQLRSIKNLSLGKVAANQDKKHIGIIQNVYRLV